MQVQPAGRWVRLPRGVEQSFASLLARLAKHQSATPPAFFTLTTPLYSGLNRVDTLSKYFIEPMAAKSRYWRVVTLPSFSSVKVDSPLPAKTR
jgi:hypothetical protein